MARKSPVCPRHKENRKRSAAKLKKGKGIFAMRAAGMDQIEWTRKFDPLYKVKGTSRIV